MAEPLLSIAGLSIIGDGRNGQVPILQDVSLRVGRGEIIGLVGESGSGKSTLGLAALGYVRSGCRITAGSIEFDGQPLLECSRSEIRRLRGRRISYVAQSATAFFNPATNLLDQTIESIVSTGQASRRAAETKAKELYRVLQLPDPDQIGDAYPHQVSGGQLQRIMTAMAMIAVPDVIIFDEPTTALDVTTQVEVLGAIRNVVRVRGAAAIFISHDLPVVAQMADHVAIMRKGCIVEQASTREILQAPKTDYTRSLWAMRVVEPPQRAATAPHLDVRGLRAGYGSGPETLSCVDFVVPRGRTVAVVGESGSGKSTLARVITGLLPAREGTVVFEGRSMKPGLRDRSLADRQAIQLIHQSADTSLNPRQRVRDLIGHPANHFLGVRGKPLRDLVVQTLEMMELDDRFVDRFPGELSGGQKQRVAIARALIVKPKLIICDEITSALDQIVQKEILSVLRRLQAELGISLMFITHDLVTVEAIADEVVVMQHGRIIEHGPRDTILRTPKDEYTRKLLASVPKLDPNWLDARLATRI